MPTETTPLSFPFACRACPWGGEWEFPLVFMLLLLRLPLLLLLLLLCGVWTAAVWYVGGGGQEETLVRKPKMTMGRRRLIKSKGKIMPRDGSSGGRQEGRSKEEGRACTYLVVVPWVMVLCPGRAWSCTQYSHLEEGEGKGVERNEKGLDGPPTCFQHHMRRNSSAAAGLDPVGLNTRQFPVDGDHRLDRRAACPSNQQQQHQAPQHSSS